MDLPAEVVIWTSSHGTDYHHLPAELEKIYSKNTNMQEYLNKPLINAKPGRLMNSQFMQDFTSDFQTINPSTTRLSIILMGDNDLRCLGVSGCYRVLNNTRKLIKLHENSQHALLIFGLMPSPATHHQTSGHADYCDFRVRKEIERAHEIDKSRNIGFVKTSVFFDDPQGFIRNRYYFCPDGVHLKPAGAKCLAKNILNKSFSFLQVISGSSALGFTRKQKEGKLQAGKPGGQPDQQPPPKTTVLTH